MDVILKQDVESLGQKGEVVHVAPGYARNFLFPRLMAVAATAGNLRNLEHFIASAQKKREAEREAARQIADKLGAVEIKIEARAGEKNRLFGSVTAAQIADAVNAAMSLDIDKKKVEAGGGLKTLGKHKVKIHVYPGVVVEKEIEIVAIEGDVVASEPLDMPAKPKKAKSAAKSEKKALPPASKAVAQHLTEPEAKEAEVEPVATEQETTVEEEAAEEIIAE